MRFHEIISEKLIDNPVGRVVRSTIRSFNMSPKAINNGWCWGFANRLKERLGDGAKVVDTTNKPGSFPGHSVVFYKGAYYDAESPDGVPTIGDLAYCKRMRAIADGTDELTEDASVPAIDPEIAAKILASAQRGVKLSPSAKLYRGESEESGSGMAVYGLGFYFTASRKEAAQYGTVKEISRTMLPDNPLRFTTINDYQLWRQRAYTLLGYSDNRDFVTDYPDVGLFVRALDPSIDGIQLFTGKDAVFVLYTNELEEGEVVPFPQKKEEPEEVTDHGNGFTSKRFNLSSLAQSDPPLPAERIEARPGYRDEPPCVCVSWSDYRTLDIPLFQLSRIMKLGVGQAIMLDAIADNRFKGDNYPSRMYTIRRDPESYRVRMTHYSTGADGVMGVRETQIDYDIDVRELQVEAQKVLQIARKS